MVHSRPCTTPSRFERAPSRADKGNYVLQRSIAGLGVPSSGLAVTSETGKPFTPPIFAGSHLRTGLRLRDTTRPGGSFRFEGPDMSGKIPSEP